MCCKINQFFVNVKETKMVNLAPYDLLAAVSRNSMQLAMYYFKYCICVKEIKFSCLYFSFIIFVAHLLD